MNSREKTVKKRETHIYCAAYYDENGTFGTIEHARKDAVRIARECRAPIVYINKDMLGNPIAAVTHEGKRWVYDLRFRPGTWYFDPKTGKLLERY